MDLHEELSQIMAGPKALASSICFRTNEKVVLFFKEHVYELTRRHQGDQIVDFRCESMQGYDRPVGAQQTDFYQIYGIIKLQVKVYIVLVTHSLQVGSIKDKPIYKATGYKCIEIGSEQAYQPLLDPFKDSFKVLDLYYSSHDLSQRLQFAHTDPPYYEHAFYCNYKLTMHHKDYPLDLITKFIFGFASTYTIRKQAITYRMTLVSRGNFNSAGRRWLRRGLNEQNYPANHFETETILEVITREKNTIYSLNQVRNSIPLLWSQTANLDLNAPFGVSSDHQAVHDKLDDYLTRCLKLQNKIILVNLINKTGRQGSLGELLDIYFKDLHKKNAQLLWFDYHAQYKEHKQSCFNRLIQQLRADIEDFGFFKMEKRPEDYQFETMKTQQGIFRTNCIDCLDRTNYVQSLIAKIYLFAFLDDSQNKEGHLYFPLQRLEIDELETAFKSLWMRNAAAISIQSTGTPAMKMDFYQKGKRTLFGKFRDFTVGARRYYYGHFSDYYYQNCLDLHFGKIDPEIPQLPIKGSWTKTLTLMASLAAVTGLSYGAYKIQSRRVEDHIKKIVYGTAGAIFTFLFGLSFIKKNSQYYIQQPIIRSQYT